MSDESRTPPRIIVYAGADEPDVGGFICELRRRGISVKVDPGGKLVDQPD